LLQVQSDMSRTVSVPVPLHSSFSQLLIPQDANVGKSQTVKAISGVQTVRFKNELERNITIKLGYANAKVRSLFRCRKTASLTKDGRGQIYKCEKESCARPGCYRSYPSDKEEHPACLVPGCGGQMNLLRCVTASLLNACRPGQY